MRGGGYVPYALAGALAVLAACGGSAGVDPTGADGGAAEGGELDGPPGEAGTDDAGDGPDAGPDARPDARPDAGPGYCANVVPSPRFCDDFDDGDPDDDWLFRNVVGGATLDLDDATYTSSPTSLFVSSKALAGGQSAPAHLRHTLLGTVMHPRLSFSTYITTSTDVTKGSLAIAALDVSLSHFFTLYLRDAPQDGVTEPAAVLEEIDGTTVTRHLLTSVPPASVWTRVVIDVDLVAGKASVSFGATKAVDGVTISKSGGTEATFRVGAVFLFGPSDPFEAHFDDVVVDF